MTVTRQSETLITGGVAQEMVVGSSSLSLPKIPEIGYGLRVKAVQYTAAGATEQALTLGAVTAYTFNESDDLSSEYVVWDFVITMTAAGTYKVLGHVYSLTDGGTTANYRANHDFIAYTDVTNDYSTNNIALSFSEPNSNADLSHVVAGY